MDLTRRAFVRNTTILAAGAAAGLTAGVTVAKGVLAHGPVEIWAHFLSKEPIAICRGTLLSDESQDIFGICIIDKLGKGTGIFEVPLSSVRKALRLGAGAQEATCLCMTAEKKESLPVTVSVDRGRLIFVVGEWGPAWLKLMDVQPVL